MSGKAEADTLLYLIEQLQQRELMAATIKVGSVEVRLGSVLQPEEPEPSPQELSERAREEEREIAQSIYGAGAAGWFPGIEEGN